MRFKMRTGLKTETKIVITQEIQGENRLENWNKIMITDETQDENRLENWNKNRDNRWDPGWEPAWKLKQFSLNSWELPNTGLDVTNLIIFISKNGQKVLQTHKCFCVLKSFWRKKSPSRQISSPKKHWLWRSNNNRTHNMGSHYLSHVKRVFKVGKNHQSGCWNPGRRGGVVLSRLCETGPTRKFF
jgi:hypothetical protein